MHDESSAEPLRAKALGALCLANENASIQSTWREYQPWRAPRRKPQKSLQTGWRQCRLI